MKHVHLVWVVNTNRVRFLRGVFATKKAAKADEIAARKNYPAILDGISFQHEKWKVIDKPLKCALFDY